MKKKWYIFFSIAVVLLLFFVIPYAKVEILTINAAEKMESFDISCWDNIYCEGTPRIYDQKIYSYRQQKDARVLYVLGDCEFGVMADLKWNHADSCWELVEYKTMWTVYGGSAQEFYWPLYYADKLYPFLDD